MVSVFVSQCVPLCVSENKSGPSAGPISFWGISSIQTFYVVAEASQERTLDGGAARPLGIKVSWGSSSGEGGAAHGPLHPALSTSKLSVLCLSRMFWNEGFHLGLGAFALGKCAWFFEPFKLRALFRLSVLGFLGTPPGWGVHRHNDFLFDDMSRTTGLTGVIVFLLLLCCVFSTGWGARPPTMTQRVRSHLAADLEIAAFNKAWHPPEVLSILVFLLVFLGLVAFFFSSGLVGFPLPYFPLPLVSWFWVVGLGISACSCV